MTQIKMLQLALTLFGDENLKVDGIYGPKTDAAVLGILENVKNGEKSDRIRTLQRVLNTFGLMLVEDGIYGEDTKLCVRILYNNMKFNGHVTGSGFILFGGRASTYGGMKDKWDRAYDQAFMPPKGKMSPKEYYEKYNDEWMVLVPEMQEHIVWPYVTNEKNEYKRAGVSFFLDYISAYYTALRLEKNSELYKLAKEKKVQVALHGTITNKVIVVPITDWGPAEFLNGSRWKYDIDISYRVFTDLGLKSLKIGKRYGDHVRWSFILKE